MVVANYMKATEKKKDIKKGLTTTNQGGEAYKIDHWRQFTRFLILGTETNGYYETAEELTTKNVKSVTKVLKEDWARALEILEDVSVSGRAARREATLFALAMAAAYEDKDAVKQATVRSAALALLPKVARFSTDLFHFVAYVDSMRGWGNSLTRGIEAWYKAKSPMALAEQVTRYAQRDGWSHRDLLRLAHPKDATRNDIFAYVTQGKLPEADSKVAAYLRAVEEAKTADEARVIELITEYGFKNEVIPTQYRTSKKVQEATLPNLGYTALLRNLGNLSKSGLLAQGSDASRYVLNTLLDAEKVKASRIHPIDVLKAKFTYGAGRGFKGNGEWTTVKAIVDALDDTFYLAFGNVTPTHKRILMGLDMSGSMTYGEAGRWDGVGYAGIGGIVGFSPRIAAAVLCMVNARVESDVEFVGYDYQTIPITISRNDSLDAVIRKCNRGGGGTNVAAPIEWAQKNGRKFDAILTFTDSETAGRNPSQAMREYRRSSGIHDSKYVVTAMLANKFSVADPTDTNMLDIAGFDASAPNVISEFVLGRV